jgi:hypothetical protein
MKTSKQDKNDFNAKEEKPNFWEKIKLTIDARPSRTASIMAVILFLFFCFSMFRFYISFTDVPSLRRSNSIPSQRLIEQIMDNIRDTTGFADRLNEYYFLMQIQNELNEMLSDTSKIDSARVEQLLKILNMK